MALAWHLKAKNSRLIDDSDSLAILTACYDPYISRFADFLWITTTGRQTNRLITLSLVHAHRVNTSLSYTCVYTQYSPLI